MTQVPENSSSAGRKLIGHRVLLAGLGNPGPKYAGNRHNVGFMAIERLARLHDISLRRRRFKARLGEGHVGPHPVVLAQPLTFMNSSGDAIGPLSRWYKIPPERVVVVYDDLDLPLGRLRLRPYGSSGGHNGMKSIINSLGTDQYPRLRVGIGRPQHGDPIDYVLKNFGPDEEPVVQAILDRVDEIVRCLLDRGVKEAMNTFNRAEMSQVGDSSR